jgi:hypothetical protein
MEAYTDPTLAGTGASTMYRMAALFLLFGAMTVGAWGEEGEEQSPGADLPEIVSSDFDPIPSDQFLEYAHSIAAWIILNSNYDAEVPLPAFVKLPRATLNYIFYSQLVGGYQEQDCIEALYVPHIMLLSEDFDMELCTATLVHELVHHFQYITEKTFSCTAEAEREAYDIQAKWVEESGVGEMPSRLFMLRLHCKNPHDYSR